MAQDVNGKELKVGDKVRALTDGGYEDAFVVGETYIVTALSAIAPKGVKLGLDQLYMHSHEIVLAEDKLKEVKHV